MERLELTITRDGNNIIGNYWRVSAWRGSQWLGEQIYAGYNKREATKIARYRILLNGSLFN